MPIYVSFLKLTAEGNKEIKKSRERFEAGKKAVEAVGGKVLNAWYIVPRAEYLIITEFPDEESRVRSAISTLQRGNVEYEVLSALPIEEYLKLTDQA
ncbi:MAG: GYD domain-containing protein [Syntrophobacteraceae bacterium]